MYEFIHKVEFNRAEFAVRTSKKKRKLVPKLYCNCESPVRHSIIDMVVYEVIISLREFTPPWGDLLHGMFGLLFLLSLLFFWISKRFTYLVEIREWKTCTIRQGQIKKKNRKRGKENNAEQRAK